MSSKAELGVSRSGRVRKKSSKLLDFESPEEAEHRLKKLNSSGSKTPAKTKSSVKAASTPAIPPLKIKKQQNNLSVVSYASDDYDNSIPDFKDAIIDEDFGDISDFPQDHLPADRHLAHEDISGYAKEELISEDVDEELDDFMEDDGKLETSDIESEYVTPSSSFIRNHSPEVAQKKQAIPARGQSLYLTEKTKKKPAGKVTMESKGKTQRKDKGKARITAYMLWAKEKRPEVARLHPEIDFSGVSKKLGELWSTVSKAERSNWKQRALRMANKAPGGMISTGSKPARARSPAKKTPSAVQTVGQTVKPTAQKRTTSVTDFENYGLDSMTSFGSLPSPTALPSGTTKLGGTEPLDVAAHLHLIGESLSVIGARLKEHEGQIAVSGSLSVLLDSALCALGPMLCLTRLTPETDGCPPETLARILDNIAYIMPGL